MKKSFAARLLRWFDRHGRHDLPWQHPRTPYRVWLSEVMLQQTQVAAVIPYFERFVARFPDIAALAAANDDDVMHLWAGLGYYARARNLLKAARTIVDTHGGKFPSDVDQVAALPGIGRSTAGAILAQAFGQRHAILDGNVRRVLARHAGIAGWPGDPKVQAELWEIAERLLPRARLPDYTQATMDLGAQICLPRAPRCDECPVRADCVAFATDRQSEIPAPRPKRARPLRKAQMLVIENRDGAILLERRPPAGIWGGLWCLPMCDGDWREYCRDALRVSAKDAQPLPSLRHAFTHFELEITPMRVGLKADPRKADSQRAWTRIDQFDALGLPSPVKKLLAGLTCRE
ncbi:MAG TPA: A/G-specific adenine glycosylase [Nevskiaceae bacterium]|nr:A/G-specific adenine glycosylase [Nevskiaceae bacterium]